MDILVVNWTGGKEIVKYVWDGGENIRLNDTKVLGEKRISKIIVEEIPIVVFRPFYKSNVSIEDAKLNSLELWEYIKNHPNDPVKSISFYIFSQYPVDEALEGIIDSTDALIELQLCDKLYVLTCQCTDGTAKKGYAPNFNKKRYSSLHIRRISCHDAVYVEDKILKVLAHLGRNPYFTDLHRHPFYITGDC